MVSVGKKTKPSTQGFECSVSFLLYSSFDITVSLEQQVQVLVQVLVPVLPQEPVLALVLQLQLLPVSALLAFCSQLLQTIKLQRKAEKK